MKLQLLLLLSIAFFSCKDKKDKFNYETSIASKVYEDQLRYLDNTLSNYSRISKKGSSLYKESSYLDQVTDEFKSKINKGELISAKDKSDFFDYFEKPLSGHQLIDKTTFNDLKSLPIKTISDVDLLKLYVKNNFVCILLNNKTLPFNSWSIVATAAKWTIKEGEIFEVALGNTAWNSKQPNEWFLLKDGTDELTKENVLDTLHQDETGMVYFKTDKYKKGQNKFIFVSKLNTPTIDEQTVSRSINFYVE